MNTLSTLSNVSPTPSATSAATLLSAQGLCLEGSHDYLFHDLSFTLKVGDAIGLIGHNGCGKSTLLNLLSGKLEAHSGSLQQARLCRMELVEQHLPPDVAALTLRQALLAAVDETQHWRVDAMLQELGLDASVWAVPVQSLSGGQHTRLLLGRALLREPNLLLLDEPSNHLDLPSLLWLEQFLQRWKGAFVLVSHDQRLLDNVTRKSWILRDQKLYDFALPCGAALQALVEFDAVSAARRASEQKEIDRLAASSQRLAIWGRTYDNEDLARKAKTMQKRVDKLKEQQSFVSQGTPWALSLQGKALSANQLLAFEGWPVHAAEHTPQLFCADQLWLKPGDKVALLGANGAGKSSLLRQCWRVIASQGQSAGLYYHAAARIGYYDQSLQQLDGELDLMDALYPFVAHCNEARTLVSRRQALIAAGFAYARHQQKVASLSGGERARLLFLALSMASYHLLLLDEPTNHLDLQGKRELADALLGFEGACLLVSHDRDLIEHSCNRFWVLVDGKLEQWLDAPSAYQRLYQMAPALELVRGSAGGSRASAVAAAPDASESEQQLARLCELEQALEADLARKPKHQKPHLQQQWRAEMASLNALLGL